jgi:hypothetical protein
MTRVFIRGQTGLALKADEGHTLGRTTVDVGFVDLWFTERSER